MNKKATVIIIILSLLVVGFGGYFVYDKFIREEEITEKKKNKEKQNDKNEEPSNYENENNKNENDQNEKDEQQNDFENNKEESNTSSSTKYFNQISVNEFYNAIEQKKDLILVLTQTGCSHCAAYKPTIEKVANEYKLNIYYLELDLLDDSDIAKVHDIVNVSGTPTTVFIKNGEETSTAYRIVGNQSASKIKARLETLGYINTRNSNTDDYITIDDYVGKNYESVQQNLQNKGLYVFIERKSVSSDVSKGEIIAQSIKSGTKVKKGASITLYIPDDTQNEIVTYPDFTDGTYSKKDVEKFCEENKLSCVFNEVEDSTKKNGTIIYQDKPAGNVVVSGQQLRFKIVNNN